MGIEEQELERARHLIISPRASFSRNMHLLPNQHPQLPSIFPHKKPSTRPHYLHFALFLFLIQEKADTDLLFCNHPHALLANSFR